MKPIERFSERVADYARFRPGYPVELVDRIIRHTRLADNAIIADIGSGTGLSARPFLERGFTVVGVEPNDPMRAAGGTALGGFRHFRSVPGSAEATGLPGSGTDLVLAAQAFHWFDHDAARREFTRILRPPLWTALVWNSRRTKSSEFMQEYEGLLLRHALDYEQVRHDRIKGEDLVRFFGGPCTRIALTHADNLDLDALTGRLLSASYTPRPDDPARQPMLRELTAIFGRYQQAGSVRFEFEAEAYIGRLAGPPP